MVWKLNWLQDAQLFINDLANSSITNGSLVFLFFPELFKCFLNVVHVDLNLLNIVHINVNKPMSWSR